MTRPSRGGVEDTRLEAKAKDTKKNSRPRPRTAVPRTDPLEAKDRNARGQGQGHRRKCSPKKKRSSQKLFSGYLHFIVYPEFLIGVSLNHKSHEMTSSKFFQKGSFCGTKISYFGRSEIAAC